MHFSGAGGVKWMELTSSAPLFLSNANRNPASLARKLGVKFQIMIRPQLNPNSEAASRK
jgi:hypothetical protein